VIDSQKSRTLGAATVLLQGVVTALFPQMSVSVMQKMIGKNFDNAAELEAKPAYRRQIRAIGVGMIAAGGQTSSCKVGMRRRTERQTVATPVLTVLRLTVTTGRVAAHVTDLSNRTRAITHT